MCIVICGCSKIEFELVPNQVDVDYSAQDVVATVNTPIACYELYSIDGEHLRKSILDNSFVYLESTAIEYKWIKVRYDSQKRTFTISLEENLTESDRTVTIIVYSTHAMSRYNPSYQHCSLKITQQKNRNDVPRVFRGQKQRRTAAKGPLCSGSAQFAAGHATARLVRPTTPSGLVRPGRTRDRK